MKKLLAILLVAVMAVSLAACGGTGSSSSSSSSSSTSASESSSSEPTSDKITIAGVVFQDDQFMQSLTKGYKDAAEDAGVECVTANTNKDQNRETELIDTYIGQKIDGIAIAPFSKTDSIAALKKAADAGIKLALTNITLEDTSFIVGGFCSDDESNGVQIGEAAGDFIKEKGWTGKIKVAIIDFYHQVPEQSKARTDGFEKGLKSKGIDYEIVNTQHDETAEGSKDKMDTILTANSDVQIVFGANEGSTIGATNAVAASKNKGKTFVFGYDGSDDTSTMILNDDDVLQAVISQDPYKMAYNAAELLIKVIKGEAQPTAKFEIVPGILLSRTDKDAVKTWRTDNGLS